MKYSKFLSVSIVAAILFSFTNAYAKLAFELDGDWKKSDATSNILDAGWSLKTDKDVSVSLLTHRLVESNEKFNEQQALREIEKGRNGVLQIIGVTDWHITDHNLVQTKNQTRLTIHGTYHNAYSILTEFKEVYVWKTTKYEAMFMSYPASTHFGTTEKSKKVIDRFIASVNEESK